MRVADVPDILQKTRVGGSDAALALDRLQQDGRGAWRNRGEKRGRVIERHLDESLDHRLKTFLNFILPRGGDARERAPMERLVESDDLETVPLRGDQLANGMVRRRRLALVAKFARDLVERLIGLSAAVAKENFPCMSNVAHQALRQERLRSRVIKIRCVNEGAKLLRQRRDHPRMAVPDGTDRNARAEIEIFIARLIPNACPLPPRKPKVEAPVVRHHVLFIQLQCLLRIHASASPVSS